MSKAFTNSLSGRTKEEKKLLSYNARFQIRPGMCARATIHTTTMCFMNIKFAFFTRTLRVDIARYRYRLAMHIEHRAHLGAHHIRHKKKQQTVPLL